MATLLGDKAVGDIVKIREDDVGQNYIIVHKGKPSDMYDDSCDGVWVLRGVGCASMSWDGFSVDSAANDYENSDIQTWLNSTFYNCIDEKILSFINEAKIPFKKGRGSASTGVYSGSNGLSAKIFLLSGREVGLTGTAIPAEGAKLDFFESGNSAQSKRICLSSNGVAGNWSLRSPHTSSTSDTWRIDADGTPCSLNAYKAGMARPAFILPADLLIDSEGYVSINNVPVVTSDKTGNLGVLADGINVIYSVNDADESDNLTVAEFLDDTQTKSFSATRNEQRTISYTENDWLKIANGSHSIKISCSDSKDTVDEVITFTRDCKQVLLKLENPFPADDVISVCSLTVDGSIPADAVCKYEVTNNALDDEPVWEDCTNKSRAGFGYVFKNKTAENGFAFNFRVTISRGESGSGGYITSISGGFE